MSGTKATTANGNTSQVLVVSDTPGVTVIDPSTPLKRLNYFDGKFLRADDFEVEQRYLRRLVAVSNQGLGPGVVHGYDATLDDGGTLQIGPGLAVDPAGNVLLVQSTVTQSLGALIDASKRPTASPAKPAASGPRGSAAFGDCLEVAAPPPAHHVLAATSEVYAIVICAAEALCGQADVYGTLCEEACVTTTDRKYRLDGVVLRAIPLPRTTAYPTSKAVNIDAAVYLRSKIAHSWFADEVLRHRDAISHDGLSSGVWCLGAGYSAACCEVPLAVVARAGSDGEWFLDPWVVRRERMDAPAKRYWQWTMRMRPWDVFLAEILQFQCQLADMLPTLATPGAWVVKPLTPDYKAIADAADVIEQVRAQMLASAPAPDKPQKGLTIQSNIAVSAAQVERVGHALQYVLDQARKPAAADRVLVRAGLIELPPAGYLPVLAGSSVPVDDQVRALVGDGVDLRFCTARPDYVARRVEAAQHMDRISLLQGIDDPSRKPRVDVFVPAGDPPATPDTSLPTLASASQNTLTLLRGIEQTPVVEEREPAAVEVPSAPPMIDWVVFARRREKSCKAAPAPTVEKTRKYRVLNVQADPKVVARQVKLLQDPTTRKKVLAELLASQKDHLVVVFGATSATSKTPAAQIEAGWKQFGAGGVIAYAAIGAGGESDGLLQIHRLHAVEAAIAVDSAAGPATTEETIVPYPQTAVPPDADGVIVFITTNIVIEQQHVYAADPDIYKLVQAGAATGAATGTAGVPSLANLVKSGRLVDLGVAKHSVGVSGSLSVDSASVQVAFKKLGAQAGPTALVLLPSGSASADKTLRLSAAAQVVQALGSTATPSAVTYPGTWPSADDSSIVVLQTINK